MMIGYLIHARVKVILQKSRWKNIVGVIGEKFVYVSTLVCLLWLLLDTVTQDGGREMTPEDFHYPFHYIINSDYSR